MLLNFIYQLIPITIHHNLINLNIYTSIFFRFNEPLLSYIINVNILYCIIINYINYIIVNCINNI